MLSTHSIFQYMFMCSFSVRLEITHTQIMEIFRHVIVLMNFVLFVCQWQISKKDAGIYEVVLKDDRGKDTSTLNLTDQGNSIQRIYFYHYKTLYSILCLLMCTNLCCDFNVIAYILRTNCPLTLSSS